MPRLIACSSCQAHVRADDRAGCPHCGTAIRTEGGVFTTTAIAALMGLSGIAVGCEKGGSGPIEPEYGAPMVQPEPGPTPADSGDKPMPVEPEYGAPVVDPPSPTDPQMDPPAEPEYGVAISDPEIQPDYGVADPSEL